MAIPDAAAPGAATPDAVPGANLHFDPSNPAALGYDPSNPDFAGVREQAQGDPDLAHAFRAELRRETARFGAWARAWRRRGAGGCGWSGPSDPFTPTRPEALLERASAALDHRRDWAASPTGVIARRLAEAEAAAQVLSGVLLEARAALERAPMEQDRRPEGFKGARRADGHSDGRVPGAPRAESLTPWSPIS